MEGGRFAAVMKSKPRAVPPVDCGGALLSCMKSALILFAPLVATSFAADWKPNLPDRELFEEGRYVYEQNCLVCHGQFGDGKGELAPGLTIKPRSFRTGVFKYRSTPAGKLPTNEDLKRTVRDGVTGTAMGMFTNIRQEELAAVVEYIKGFSRKWKDAANYAPPVKLPAPPAWFADAAQRKEHEQAGARIFETTCASCHGAGGKGDGPAAAALKDDLGDPAQPADLTARNFRNGNDPQDIFRVLALGIAGTPMVAFDPALSEAQRWDLAAYLRRLSGVSAD
ncbi:MAG: Selenate reductase subunit gamma precursor [Verrucomicrobiota bacterium]|jgi:mono/diheme cytochrome c family protein